MKKQVCKIESGGRSAFTLIEMILAIGIASLAILCATAALFTSMRLRNAASDMVEAAIPLDQTLTYLRRDLQCCVTPTNGTGKVLSGSFRTGNAISSTGISDPVQAEFYTATGALGQNAPWADIQRVSYGLKNSTDISGRRDLYRSVVRNLLPTSVPEVDEQLLLAGVESMKFSCYTGTQWIDVWDTSDYSSENTNLPLAVRVEIQLAGSRNDDLVKLVVPIDSVSRTNRTSSTDSSSSESSGD